MHSPIHEETIKDLNGKEYKLYFFLGQEFKDEEKYFQSWENKVLGPPYIHKEIKQNAYVIFNDKEVSLKDNEIPKLFALKLLQNYGEERAKEMIQQALQNIRIKETDILRTFPLPSLPKVSGTWVAFLTSSNDIIGYAKGFLVGSDLENMRSIGFTNPEHQYIDFVQIRPDYLGKGLCQILMNFVFKQLKIHHYKTVVLDNTVGEIGSKCYVKGSTMYYPTFQCLDEQSYPFCHRMQFSS